MINIAFRSATSNNDSYEQPVIDVETKPPTINADDFLPVNDSKLIWVNLLRQAE